MDFRIHLAACLVLGAWSPTTALAQNATPVAMDRIPRRPTAPARGLPRALARVPRTSAAAVHAPKLIDLLDDLQSAAELWSVIEPSIRGRAVPEIAVDLLWGSGLGLGWSSKSPARPALRALMTADGLEAVGVDPEAAITAAFDPKASVAVVRFGLIDRPRWERWLDELGGASRARADLSGEQASVLAPDSDTPVTCVARRAEATCQLGAAQGNDPLGPLRAATGGRGARLAGLGGIERAYRALPNQARLYGVVNTPQMADWLSGLAKAHEARAQRFARPEARRRAIAEARALRRKVRHLAAKIEGTALGLYRQRDGVALRMESALSPLGSRLLRPHLRPYGEHLTISQWSDTPALAQLILRTHPETTRRLLRAIDLDLPASLLTGDLALLTLGVDAECPMAKKKRAQRDPGLSWAFLLPSAAAVGLAGPRAATEVRAKVQPHAGAEPAERQARAHDHPYEIDVLDQVMLVATGHGTGSAAMRRMRELPKRAARAQPPLLEASIDLHAIDAAFGSGSFDTEHRSELLAMEALRLSLAPLLTHVSRLSLRAEAPNQGRRLSVELVSRR